ncbi:MAG TPA: hypothetical protein VGL71_12920 [Urbifossiella sp.]
MIANLPTVADTILGKIRIRTDRRVKDLIVEVHENGDGVTLRGRADSFHVKQLAQHSVREVLPTVPLQNAIVVERN